MTQVEKKSKKPAWFWWVLFPPYALYGFLRYSPLKWYFKAPLLALLSLIVVLSIDLALSPHRVEEAHAETAMTDFLKKEATEEALQKMERLGEGISFVEGEKSKGQSLVYYRVVTDISVYHVGFVAEEEKSLSVHQAEKLFPMRVWLTDDQVTKAEVAVWLKANEEEVGKPLQLLEDDAENSVQRVKTSKGTYDVHYGNQRVYEVNAIEGNESVFKEENAPALPEEVMNYLEENPERAGELVRVHAYEMQAGVESYYFTTSEGAFLSELFPDGTIELKKRNEQKE